MADFARLSGVVAHLCGLVNSEQICWSKNILFINLGNYGKGSFHHLLLTISGLCKKIIC